MKRILLSIATVAFLAGGVIGGTGAFFGDTETSTGNTFAAGAIDLKIDNDSYYNGNRCVDTNGEAEGGYVWQGQALYPVPGTECTTSFVPSDLDDGLLFFDFRDVKPDDDGEDTISIHVENDAWMCLDLTLTSDDDESSNEPELEVDVLEDANNTWDGELADAIQMIWWADDGDNVYEVGENLISGSVQSITDLFGQDRVWSVPLADNDNNAWTVGEDEDPNPVPGGEVVYIAKVWCLGTLNPTPLPQLDAGGPQERGNGGYTCDGTNLGNIYQTDGVTMDIAFRAVQARHNPDFRCGETEERVATLTVNKVVVNDNGGNNVIADFQLQVVGTGVTNVTSGVPTQLVAPQSYIVTETGITGYVASFSGDCDVNGNITLQPGDNKVCTITNNDLPANITLIKNVVGGTAQPVQFIMRVDGQQIQNNTSTSTLSNVNHVISEDAFPGYTFTSITGAGCPASLNTPFVLNEGQAIVCTITNTSIPN